MFECISQVYLLSYDQNGDNNDNNNYDDDEVDYSLHPFTVGYRTLAVQSLSSKAPIHAHADK